MELISCFYYNGDDMDKLLLMSIKTKYVRAIFNGSKIYEFRRKSIGNDDINKKIYIYSSGVDKAIVGYIIVDKILEDNLDNILKITNNIGNKDIINYFNNSKCCYAFHISKYYKFLNPLSLNDIRLIDKNFVLPQFYRYIRKDELLYNKIKNLK